ncbi:hypothetical protein RAS1_39990 [Phycisphaerae bacterium RAS1]|nr:hypothetical protein RAS1_39990 [Phycisphaerae bacterium RAS1]
MRFRLLALTCLTFFPLAALAQNPPPPPPGGEDGPRRMGRGRDGGMMFGGPGRMLGRLPQQLQLDDEQKTRFEELLAAHRERMRAFGEQMREARQAADEGSPDTAEQLRNQLRDSDVPNQSVQQLFDDLEPLLREEQLEKLDSIREDNDRRGDQMQKMMRMREELPEQLQLTPEQEQQFDNMLRERRESMRERMSGMRPLMEEMRAAREAGDEARVAELEKQMEAGQPDMTSMQNEFFEQLAAILNADQQKLLAEYRAEFTGEAAGKSGSTADLKTILRAARRARLTSEQKDELRDIEKESLAAQKKLNRRDKEAQAALASQVREKIERLLEPQQKERFEQVLERSQRGARSR